MTSASETRPSAPGAFSCLRIAAVDRLCADAVAVTFDVPAGLADRFAHRAGQAVTIKLPTVDGDIRRSYSVVSPELGPLRVGVREVPGGAASTWLVRSARVGDAIEVAPPSGGFTADLTRAGRHVMIGAGSGITPLLSLAATVLAHPDSQVTLLYGNRRADTVMFADQLADLKDSHLRRLHLVHVLSRESQDVALFNGRLDPDKIAELLAIIGDMQGVDHWWLCGPYPMVVGAVDLLRAKGVSGSKIHRELFFVDDQPMPSPATHPDSIGEGAQVTAQLDGRSMTATVGWDMPVLDGLQRVRSDVPFACKGGVCGTCRAKVLDGRVEMRRNYALEPWEVDAGFVLTCQALCITPEVTLDYDA